MRKMTHEDDDRPLSLRHAGEASQIIPWTTATTTKKTPGKTCYSPERVAGDTPAIITGSVTKNPDG
jgi:hypothetical protein